MIPPPLPESQQDRDQLNLLKIFHYVWAGLSLVGLLFLIGHFFIMKMVFGMIDESAVEIREVAEKQSHPDVIISAEDEFGEAGTPFVEEEVKAEVQKMTEKELQMFQKMSGFLVVFYVIFGALIVFGIVLNFLSARYMAQRKNKVFSMVTAGVNCLGFPLGTALGVFTFVVLSRPSVEVTYQRKAQSLGR